MPCTPALEQVKTSRPGSKYIAEYDFKEGVEYTRIDRQKYRSEYLLLKGEHHYLISLDMAKELALLERTEGNQARQQIRELEKEWWDARGKSEHVFASEDEDFTNTHLPSGERFCEERLRLGYTTHDALAQTLNVSRRTIEQYEHYHAKAYKYHELYMFFKIGMDIQYWYFGKRTVSAAERTLIAKWRSASQEHRKAIFDYINKTVQTPNALAE